MQVKYALKKLIKTLRSFIPQRGKMTYPIIKLDEALRGLFKKRERMMRFIVVMFVMVCLCITSSGLTLIQLSNNNPSGTNGLPNSVPDSTQVVPTYPPIAPISNVGSFKTIGIGAYWDENATDKVETIDWGILEPGTPSNVTMYLQNDGNSDVTLSKSTSNWNPTVASNYLTLNWDYDGQMLEPDENLPVTLTLSVSGNVTGVTDFDFDITVLGTEQS